MAKVMAIGDKLKLTVEGRMENGVKGKLAVAPAWTVSPALLVLAPAPDGLACVATALAPGDCEVQVTVDKLVEVYAISVLPGASVRLVVSAEEITA